MFVTISLIISLFLSLNRGSWLAITFSIVVSAAFYVRHIKIRWVIIGMALFLLIFSQVIVSRFQELGQSTEYGSKNTFLGRVAHWKKAYPLIINRPIIGFGTGTSSLIMSEDINEPLAMHNDYLLLWLESGSFALLGYLIFMSRNALYFLRRRESLSITNFAMTVMCIYFPIISITQNILMNVTVFPMYLGLVAAGVKVNNLFQNPGFGSHLVA